VQNETLREQLRGDLVAARRQTDELFRMLAPEALYERPILERHRLIFYLGHLEAFDWNMICATAFGLPAFNSQFDRLFAFGIDPIDGQLPSDQPEDWPQVSEILAYNNRTRQTVDDLLGRVDFENTSERYLEGGQIFRVAVEHRLMHAETLAYMFHWLDYNSKRMPGATASIRYSKLQNKSQAVDSVIIPAGETTLGQDRGVFGWDNEFESHSIAVPEFQIDIFNVTNGQFLEFVAAGGYQHRSLWTDEAWAWIQQTGIQHPKFWIRRGDRWLYRSMFEEIPLPSEWPVFVSHAEASAYARWKGKALPSEEQYHRAAFGAESSTPQGNFDFKSWAPEPVGASSDRANGFGIYDLIGNGWEWTCTPFAPFEGFQAFPFYPGYSADFFDGKHFVMKGASPRTAASLVRKSFRNWFQPHYPNVYATFRCVQ
jgi:ergothioneine biosynthesis protein EgtB